MVQAERKSNQAFRLRKVESSGKGSILSYGHRPAQNYAQQWAAVDVKKLRSFLAPLFVATKPKCYAYKHLSCAAKSDVDLSSGN
jgi:hypothetical protein